jgi:hypothetical protein
MRNCQEWFDSPLLTKPIFLEYESEELFLHTLDRPGAELFISQKDSESVEVYEESRMSTNF